MKITVQNLGTIKKTTLDLQPLTVIIGPNNTSKTYLAYLVYGLLQQGGDGLEYLLAKLHQDRMEHFNFESDVISPPIAASELFHSLLTALRELASSKASALESRLSDFFQDTSRRIFRQTRVTLDLPLEQIASRWEEEIVKLRTVDSVNQMIFLVVHFIQSLIPAAFLLPAERNALIITYRMLANRRFKLLRESQRGIFRARQITERQMALLREQGDLRYPEPIEDFLDFLTDIELEPHDSDPPFQALAAQIEAALQGGQRTRFSPTALGGQEIKIDVSPKLTIDLYNASSSIKQLAPLLLFLRHRARPGTQLIIDEPEMNLHPESQARLLEALGILVNLGVNVLLTTHSPYFMSHLNNLAAGAADPEQRARQAKHLYLGDDRAFVPLDRISAYEMRSGKLVSLKDPDYGIRWDTLSDVSADLQQKYFQITEAAEGDGKA